MEEKNIPYQLIDDYLNGRLSEEEARAFEQEVEKDAELRAELQSHVKAELAVRLAVTEARKEEFLAEYDNIYPKEKRIRSLRPFVLLTIAAAVALLLLFTYSNYLAPDGNTPMSSQELFAQNYQPAPINWNAGQRGNEDPQASDKLWQEAQQAYENGNYEEAAGTLKELIQDSTHQSHPKAWFTLGLVYMKRAETNEEEASRWVAEAQKSFDSVSPTSIYFADGQWYKALSFLLLDQKAACKDALQDILNAPNGRKKDAEQLLEMLAS